MKYMVLIGISSNELFAADVSGYNQAENISIEGNLSKQYENQNDIMDFLDSLKDFYNIDSFADLDMSFLIVNALSNQEELDFLYGEISKMSNVNVINAERILGIIGLAKGMIKPSKSIITDFLGQRYKITSDEKYRIVSEVADSGVETEPADIGLEDFSLLYFLDGSFIANQEEIEHAYKKQLDEQQKRLDSEKKKLNNCLKEETEKLKRAEQRAGDLEKKYKEVIEKYERRVERAICTLDGEASGTYEVNRSVGDGCDVKKGKVILTAQRPGYSCYSSALVAMRAISDPSFWIDVKSPTDGRVFFMVKDGQKVKKGDVVAVIGAKTDTREEIESWLKSMRSV